MKRLLTVCFVLVLSGLTCQGQLLNCRVSVDAQQTGQAQLSIFSTLQNALQEFLNQEKWSEQSLPQEQRVQCNFFITIHTYSSSSFEATLQVQSSRPVFGSSLMTPIFNYRDAHFSFTYDEGQPLRFNPNTFESNVVATLSFYAYVILGMDADSFAPDGGSSFFDRADQVARAAEQAGGGGWSSASGTNSRYELNRQLQSAVFQNFHQVLYVYHRLGLDRMSEEVELGKENILKAIELLHEVHEARPNSLLVRSFFDAKAQEIAGIFSGGPGVELVNTPSLLTSMAPGYSNLWQNLR